jgi:surface protein
MSVRYGNKVGPLVSRKSSFFKKDRFDNLRIKKPSSNMWIRPTDWLAMPTITSSEQKIAILMPVYPQGSNFLAFTVAEAYTVDWGDGVTENVATGIKAQHEYSYADADLNVTVASGGYKMAIVIITPQAGQNITSVNFNQKYALTGSVFPDTSPILEIVLSCPNLTSITLGNLTATSAFCKSLVSFSGVNMGQIVSFANLFSNLVSLENVSFDVLASILDTNNMFANCRSLKNVPLFNTAAVGDMGTMFSNCSSLTSVPLFNTAAVTNMGSMFSGCRSLTSVPLFNTAAAIFINSTFSGCVSLTSVPLFNTAAVTDMSSTFSGCLSLATVPLLISGAGTTTSKFSNMFNSCASLTRAALSGAEYSISFTGCKLSKEELESIFNNLDTIGAPSQTLTISNNWGAPTTVTRTGTTTAGGTTITMANTVDIAVGMQITGTGTPLITARAVTFTDEGDLITLASHGLSNGDEVAFSVITSTTGIIINKIYFVVNAAAETFQIAATSGGAVLPLTTNGSGSLRYRTEVVSINPNVNITISRPTSSAATSSLTFRQLRTGTAILKGWTVTG